MIIINFLIPKYRQGLLFLADEGSELTIILNSDYHRIGFSFVSFPPSLPPSLPPSHCPSNMQSSSPRR